MLLKISSTVILNIVLGLLIVIPGGCNNQSNLLIMGAWDIVSPIERKVIPDYISETINFHETSIEYSNDPISGLKKGNCDMVILGREPTPEELNGLVDTVISYDAICILVDFNSYVGGEFWKFQTDDDTLKVAGQPLFTLGWVPVVKVPGIRDLTTEDLKVIFNYYLLYPPERWNLPDYYVWDSLTDLDTGVKSNFRQWLSQSKPLITTMMLNPGTFDTQTVLYQELGLDERSIFKASGSVPPFDESEEQVLQRLYPPTSYTPWTNTFEFKLGFASRRVTQTALLHTSATVVSVSGINPVDDITAIYNGTYPLSRKIHLLTRQKISPPADRFREYILSQDGQQAMASAGFLPLK
ncbi:MAG: hypothetical protein JW967_11030 [Dehalococcoidales bacterium]|nr:hypothetical protein [Dehalococcoidales bacterium]